MILIYCIIILISYLPVNRLYLFLTKKYYNNRYFSFKEAIYFLGSSDTLLIIFFNLLKPIFVYYLLYFYNGSRIDYWVSGFILIFINLINKEILKFRGTMYTITYLFLLQDFLIGAVLGLYFFVLVFLRSQSKASLFSITFLLGINLYNIDPSKIFIYIVPSIAIIYYNYGLFKIKKLNIFTFFLHRNNI